MGARCSIFRSPAVLEQNSKEICEHPQVLNGMCTSCGQFTDDSYGVAFDYIQEGLRLSKDEITRLKNANSKNLFEEKKLLLVLDLDHTLLHAKGIEYLTSEEKYLLDEQIDSSKDVSNGTLFKLDSETIVKLRPFLFTFLKEVSTMFEMYIYTMGNRCYAMQVAELLDPKGDYFGNRIISRDDLNKKGKKTLDLVLGRECGIIILDDNECAWCDDDQENVVVMKGYSYFARNSKKKSYSEKKDDESESNGALAYILIVLRAIHSLFFGPLVSSLPWRDVRMLMQIFRRKVLKGCVIFLSDVDRFHIDYPDIKLKAEELGAEFSHTLDSSSVTHVVSIKNNWTEDCIWAVMENKFLVNPRWIFTSYYLWHRQPEDRFFVLK